MTHSFGSGQTHTVNVTPPPTALDSIVIFINIMLQIIVITIKIYIYIKWTVFVNVTTKSAQHAHARMIAIIVEKSHMYDHGFMDNTNRQACTSPESINRLDRYICHLIYTIDVYALSCNIEDLQTYISTLL